MRATLRLSTLLALIIVLAAVPAAVKSAVSDGSTPRYARLGLRPLGANQTPAQTSGAIAGRVTDAASGAPINHILVHIYNAESSNSAVTIEETDSNGNYQTAFNLPTGNYRLRFSTIDAFQTPYAAEYYNDKPTFASADVVTVRAGETTTVNSAMNRGGKITGRIVAADTGSALEGVRITFLDSAGQMVNVVMTDANGSYEGLGILPTGIYYVFFDPTYSNGEVTGRYMPQYHGGSTSLEGATPVQVAVGSAVTINATLQRGGEVRGVVTAADTGQVLENVRVELYDSSGSSISSTSTDANGTYSFYKGITTGLYRLLIGSRYVEPNKRYLPEYYNNRRTFEQADQLQITTGSVTTADIALDLSGTLHGSVTDAATGQGIAGVDVVLLIGTTSPIASTVTDASGNYRFDMSFSPELLYRVRFEPTKPYLIEYYGGGYTPGTASSISVPLGVDVTASGALDKSAVIRGRLTAADTGQGLVDARVTIYSDDDRMR